MQFLLFILPFRFSGKTFFSLVLLGFFFYLLMKSFKWKMKSLLSQDNCKIMIFQLMFWHSLMMKVCWTFKMNGKLKNCKMIQGMLFKMFIRFQTFPSATTIFKNPDPTPLLIFDVFHEQPTRWRVFIFAVLSCFRNLTWDRNCYSRMFKKITIFFEFLDVSFSISDLE